MSAHGLTYAELQALDKNVAEGPPIAQDAAFGAFIGGVVGLLDGGVLNGAFKGMVTGAVVSVVCYRWKSWVSQVEHDIRDVR